MNSQPTSKQNTINTRTEMASLIREIAMLKLEEKQLAASLDADIQKVHGLYETRLSGLSQLLKEKTGMARDWAEKNLAEFGERRSVDFGHGVAGFRLGPPKLERLAKWKWDSVLQALRAVSWGKAYLRLKEEINKEQVLADFSADILDEADLRKIGAQVVQEESFFVEPKLTRVESREAVAV